MPLQDGVAIFAKRAFLTFRDNGFQAPHYLLNDAIRPWLYLEKWRHRAYPFGGRGRDVARLLVILLYDCDLIQELSLKDREALQIAPQNGIHTLEFTLDVLAHILFPLRDKDHLVPFPKIGGSFAQHMAPEPKRAA
ncbi:hypothetical protein [Acidiferrobacter sp.]|uniref:hypothetical protein n=1 Tax=Acidiferrobacter sp. TaxID=1872107 RepID=UPI00261D0770|nr:hypothetical protein [Acidiferrobacter sp.]